MPIPLLDLTRQRQEIETELVAITRVVAEAIGSKLLSLPLYPQMTEAQVHEVANAVKAF